MHKKAPQSNIMRDKSGPGTNRPASKRQMAAGSSKEVPVSKKLNLNEDYYPQYLDQLDADDNIEMMDYNLEQEILTAPEGKRLEEATELSNEYVEDSDRIHEESDLNRR